MRGPVVIGGDNLSSLVRIGLTDLPNIGGASDPPGPPGSGITGIGIGYVQGHSNEVKDLIKALKSTIHNP